jgi:hypothetical protein
MSVAGDEIVGDGGTAALVRQMGEHDTGPSSEGFHVVVIVAADADAGIAHLAGVGLGIGDELGIGLGREVLGGSAEHERNLAQPRHQGDVLLVVDLEFLLVDDGGEHIGAGIADLQRIAVGSRTRHLLDRKDAEGAGLVFDHHRLPENRPHMLADDAHDDIGGAARSERHDDFDRLRRIFVLRGDLDAAEGEQKHQQNAQALHDIFRFRRCSRDIRKFMRKQFALTPMSRHTLVGQFDLDLGDGLSPCGKLAVEPRLRLLQ